MIIYVDNFRGFSNTSIDLKEVNFFIGENSTGKTSILKLIKLFSQPNLWWTLDFSGEDLNFNLFQDLCKADSENKHIHIGLLDNDKPQTALLLILHEKNSLTTLKGFRYFNARNKQHIEVTIGNLGKPKVRYELFNDDQEINIKWFKKNDLAQKKFEEFESKNQAGFFQAIDGNKKRINTSQTILFTFIEALNFIRAKNPDLKVEAGFGPPSMGLGGMILSAPIRTEPKRTYDNYFASFKSDGSHIPYVLRDILAKKNGKQKELLKYVNAFGKASGLFDNIDIKEFGQESISPFEIDIILNDQPINLVNVGYGVSQILPILIEILTSDKGSVFALQQPEIHLHPKGQAALGEFFYESWLRENKRFFIETHSDYMVDRFRITMLKNKKNYKKHIDKCQVLFFSRDETGNKVYPIQIEEDGKYIGELPREFGDFFVKEELDLFSLNFD